MRPVSKLVQDFIKANILTKFHAYGTENVAYRVYTSFWPSDLVFYPTWPIFKILQDFIEANILTKFHEYQTKNKAFTAYTKFY